MADNTIQLKSELANIIKRLYGDSKIVRYNNDTCVIPLAAQISCYTRESRFPCSVVAL